MRPKVLLTALLIGLATLGLMWLARPGEGVGEHRPPTSLAATANIRVEDETPRAPSRKARSLIVVGDGEQPIEMPFPQEVGDDPVGIRIAELMDLAMSDNTNSLRMILSELTNREPRIREAAVVAAVQFRSPTAIASLRNIYPQTDDPEEKLRILNAIDFLTVSLDSEATDLTPAAVP